MSYGLQVFNSNGSLQVDISSKLQRQVALATLTAAPWQYNYEDPYQNRWMYYFFSVPGLTLDGTYFVECKGDGYGNIDVGGVHVYINGWDYVAHYVRVMVFTL
jgi:hypothetical protein